MTGGKFTRGFTGCIHGFELQDSGTIDLGAKALSGVNVKPCSRLVYRNIRNTSNLLTIPTF